MNFCKLLRRLLDLDLVFFFRGHPLDIGNLILMIEHLKFQLIVSFLCRELLLVFFCLIGLANN